MSHHRGACHCGAIRLQFESAKAPTELQVRACGCRFCRTHGARTMTDPDGHARIEADAQALNRYRFGLMTADFLVCRDCGAYVAAYFEDDDKGYATLNVNTFEDRAAFERQTASVDYDAEDAAGRVARRLTRWTPTDLIVQAPGGAPS